MKYERLSGGEGLAGKWKSTKLELGASEEMQITDYSSGNVIEMFIPRNKISLKGKFDRPAYEVTGLTIPAGASGGSCTGKPFRKDTVSVSEDGKPLTMAGGMVGVNEPKWTVYEGR